MPTLREHQQSAGFRAICIGDSGTGKTGSLAEVINQMDVLGIKKVVIADFDDGLDVLSFQVKPEKMDSVHYEVFRDKLQTSMEDGAKINTTAELDACWARAVRFCSNWPNVGNLNKLGLDSLFVVDSLTGLGDSNFNYAMSFGKEKGDAWRATGNAMRLQDKFIQMCRALECHFILMSHIRFMGGGGTKIIEDKKGSKYLTEVDSASEGQAYPSALGRQLPPQIGRHFNVMLEYKLIGRMRKIRTVPEERFGLKLPFKMEDELPQETGLFTIMKKFLNK